MPSVRYITNVLPVSHINGKMAPVKNIVTNSPDGQQLKVEGYWYGFRRRGNSANRFGIRTIRRNLITNPYTAAEDENRTLFTMSLQVVHESLQIPYRRQLCMDDFLLQERYTTLIGYAVAVTRANNGEWPERWSV